MVWDDVNRETKDVSVRSSSPRAVRISQRSSYRGAIVAAVHPSPDTAKGEINKAKTLEWGGGGQVSKSSLAAATTKRIPGRPRRARTLNLAGERPAAAAACHRRRADRCCCKNRPPACAYVCVCINAVQGSSNGRPPLFFWSPGTLMRAESCSIARAPGRTTRAEREESCR